MRANIDNMLSSSRKQQIDRTNITKENIELIMSELNVPKLTAEKALLDNNNDIRAALTHLITQ
jgi:NACalpha-BTF3-like transcription factor